MRTPEDDELATIHALRAASLQTGLAAARFAKTNALNSTDLRALIGLLDRRRDDAPATPGWLGEHLGINSASVTALVDRLADRGLVERQRDTRDRRRVLLAVSPAAETLGTTFFTPVFDALLKVEAEFTADELATVRRYLQAAARSVQDVGD